MSNYYVFRINYEDHFTLIRDELLKNNLLRQGWGTYDMSVEPGYDAFKEGWQKHWEPDLEDNIMRTRYENLKKMLEIKPGDYIIVPKISVQEDYVSQSFVIARCKAKYRFSVLEQVQDFGHIIEVEDVFSCGYDKNAFSQTIKSKFRAYQSPLNRVRNEDFIVAVDELVRLHTEDPDDFEKNSLDYISMVAHKVSDSRNQYLEKIKNALQNIGNIEFENLICELFEKNGYICTGRHWYDKEGGDVDLIFECFNQHTLMYNIFEICDVKMPHIYVQAKKKKGNDSGDIAGVEQLLKMKEHISENNAILIVINLTDKFSSEANELAKNNGIILIDGFTFASLLVRYGFEVDLK